MTSQTDEKLNNGAEIQKPKKSHFRTFLHFAKIVCFYVIIPNIVAFYTVTSVVKYINFSANNIAEQKVQKMRNEIIAELNQSLETRDNTRASDIRTFNSNLKFDSKQRGELWEAIKRIHIQGKKEVEINNGNVETNGKNINQIHKRIDKVIEAYNKNNAQLALRLSEFGKLIADNQRLTDEKLKNLPLIEAKANALYDAQPSRDAYIEDLLRYRAWLESKYFGTFKMPETKPSKKDKQK